MLQSDEWKAPINMFSRSKAPETQQAELWQPVIFTRHQPNRYVGTRKNFG